MVKWHLIGNTTELIGNTTELIGNTTELSGLYLLNKRMVRPALIQGLPCYFTHDNYSYHA